MVVILIGVSGSGKTTVGQEVARSLGWSFVDADEFHSEANKTKLKSGEPLRDEDRWPWLRELRTLISQKIAARGNLILACSALKGRYREILRVRPEVEFVYLKGSYELISTRLNRRRDHFMNPILLRSQFADLEEPASAEALTVPVDAGPGEVAAEIIARLAER